MSNIEIRACARRDVAEMCAILNGIVGIGGMTALQKQFTESGFAKSFLECDELRCCFAAVDGDGAVAGFQMLHSHKKLPENWGDIGSYARVSPKIAGVGTALFAQTKRFAANVGLEALNATIRADNRGGLAYYGKMGFETYSVARDVPLADGTLVDRISKKFVCTRNPTSA